MQTILPFEQSKHIIESRAKKGINLSIGKQQLKTFFHDDRLKIKQELTTFTVTVNNKEVFRFPGTHIPNEFIKDGWASDDMELLLSQIALHLDNGSSAKMTFALDEQATFRSNTGKVEKVLLVNFNLAGLLYKYVRLGEQS